MREMGEKLRRAQLDITTILGIAIILFVVILIYKLYFSPITLQPPSFIIKPRSVSACLHQTVRYEVTFTNPNDVPITLKIEINSPTSVNVLINGEECSICTLRVPAKGTLRVEILISSNVPGSYLIKGKVYVENTVIGGFALPALFKKC